MNMKFLDCYDVAIIGGGHAGVEAALASARLGKKTVIFTISLDQIANLPCNPSIGGSAKGHLVREIDALGGEMALAADKNFIQSRVLNRGKGPAVHSLRVQADRMSYHTYMKNVLENQENLDIKQAEITQIYAENGKVFAVETKIKACYKVKTVIVCTGTYLRGTVHVGHTNYPSGPDNCLPANELSASLKDLGLTIRRFKTGTPARVHKRSIDFDLLEEQQGDSEILPFSFQTNDKLENKVSCHICYTNENTHKIILDNIKKSALFSGNIEGTGPRYCPSIEDKIVRFADKKRHQVFIEPMGLDTDEYYLQGLSTSLPEEVQIDFLHSIKGLENVEIMRNAYAIEYDCCDPTELLPTLESKIISGLFGAGQFNGTSGYEEAAAQGLVAGINAVRKINDEKQLVLERSNSYIGTLIDDLVTKGVQDPYRMMTSRSEYRLLLRQDNADIRLIPIGYEFGLVSKERYERLQEKLQLISQETERIKKVVIAPSKTVNEYLESVDTTPLSTGIKLYDLIKRPQVSLFDMRKIDLKSPDLPFDVIEQVELQVKYEGYIKIQAERVIAMEKLESKQLLPDFDYKVIKGLRLEAIEKLNKIKPLNVGQASRISGVNPADVSVLLIWLELNKKGD